MQLTLSKQRTLSRQHALSGRAWGRDRRGKSRQSRLASGLRFRGGALQRGLPQGRRARSSAHAPQAVTLRSLSRNQEPGPLRYHAADLLTYHAADLLVLPTINAPLTIQREGEAPVGKATMAEAMLAMGCLWPEQWNGDLMGTMQECFHLWCEYATEREDGLEALPWWKFFLCEDLEACTEIYDPKQDREDIRMALGLEGKPVAAFVLCASSDRNIKLGDVLPRLLGHLRFAGVRPEPALASIMGALNVAGNLLGVWTPHNCRVENNRWWEESCEGEEEDYFEPERWKALPEWLFSTTYKVRSMQRLEKKLRGTETELAPLYWCIARGLELAQAMEAIRASKDHDDHCGYLSFGMNPSLAFLWNQANEPDILSDFADYQWEILCQSESHGVQWLHAFDPTSPESRRRAAASARLTLRLIGSLDRFLVALDVFAKSGPRSHEAPKIAVEAQRVRVRA